MFTLSRGQSARHGEDTGQRSSSSREVVGGGAPVLLPPLSSSPSPSPSAYLLEFQQLQQVARDVLRVHTLSTAIQYAPHAPLRVDASHWWEDIKQQSVAAATQRRTRKRRLQGLSTGNRPSATVVCVDVEDVDDAIAADADANTDVVVDALVRILHSVSAWTARIEATTKAIQTSERGGGDADTDAETVKTSEAQQLLNHLREAIGAVTVKLLAEWRNSVSVQRDRAKETGEGQAEGEAEKAQRCGVEIVNVLLQCDDQVGAFHAFHAHKLCASTAQRVFRTQPKWSCSKCNRSWETQSAAPILVFRCAPCEYTICRECYTRIPNKIGNELDDIQISRELFVSLKNKMIPHVATFIPVVMQQVCVQDKELFALIAPQMAIAARNRLQELLLYRSQEMVPLMQMVVDLFAIPGFPRLLMDREPFQWMPLYISSTKLRLHSFLGPLLWWTSMSDEPGEINLTPEGRRDGASTALTLQWLDGYRVLRGLLAKLLGTLLVVDPTNTTQPTHQQDPYVVDATLSFLATMVACFELTRRSAQSTDDLYDGMLINVSVALVQIVSPILETKRQLLDTTYHESFVPRRAYMDRPEPLRKESNASDDHARREADDARIIKVDRELEEAENDDAEGAARPYYYPPLDKHFGVLCDHCNAADFGGLRYKCAFCDDADICGQCYAEFANQPVAIDTVLTDLTSPNHRHHDQQQHEQHSSGSGSPSSFSVSSSSSSSSSSSPSSPSSSSPTGLSGNGARIHRVDHLFLRLDVPVPLIALPHFTPVEFRRAQFKYTETESDDAMDKSMSSMTLTCHDCCVSLDQLDVIYRCCNCLVPRFVCGKCVEHDERFHDPSRMHCAGHLYYAIPRLWRTLFNPRAKELVLRGLFYPACLYPRERLTTETELFYLTMRTLHVGPLHSLAKFLSVVKEIHELRSFCACEEQRVAFEKEQQQKQKNKASSSSRRAPRLSTHYAASQARLADLSATKLLAQLHLVEPANVWDWISFYSKTCRWLLELASASPTENAFQSIVTKISSSLRLFPEHFFFDLCEMVHLLTLDGMGTDSSSRGDTGIDFGSAAHGEDHNLLEPLVVMLVQILATRKCSKNPHLRVQAAKALSALVGFYAKTTKRMKVLRKVFHQCAVLRVFSVYAVLQFHEDMEGYHTRNNGLVFHNNAGSGDHLLWGFVSIRATTVLLLRFLWQLTDQRSAMVYAFQSKPTTSDTLAVETQIANQVGMLITGLWSDAAKLLEEANGKVGVLTQLAEIRDALLEGRQIQLPFRPSMLEGYIALHSKHLRLAMRTLVEVVESLSWLADETPLKRAMLKPELVDQCARTTSFLAASVVDAYQNKALASTWHHLQDQKRLFAHLVVLVVRCAGYTSTSQSNRTIDSTAVAAAAAGCSPSAFWNLVHDCGQTMLRYIGDMDVHDRWSLNRVIVRMESARYLGESTDDLPLPGWAAHHEELLFEEEEDALSSPRREKNEDELDENEALALLERQQQQRRHTHGHGHGGRGAKRQRALARQLGSRFVSALAQDGRFDADRFASGCDLLQLPTTTMASSQDYEWLGVSWVALFRGVLHWCQDMVALQASMDELLSDIPDEYLDPLLHTIMTDPVRLPSGNVVDRSVIERHLLASKRMDPFTREPLTIAMLTPCDLLRNEIQLYLKAKLQHLAPQKDDVLATWGLAWDCIFDTDSKPQAANVAARNGGNSVQ